MSLNFDEEYFVSSSNGYINYRKYPHFSQRAQWIKDNLTGNVLEVGCSYGYMLEELTALSIECYGIDKSSYADTKVNVNIKAKYECIDIKDYSIGIPFDWCVSWNVLDCLDSEADAVLVITKLKTLATNQLHVICMSGQNFIDQGYFIRDYNYWRNLLPDAYLVDYETKTVYVPNGEKLLSKVPLCWGMVSN